MKRFITIFILLTIVLMAAACGGGRGLVVNGLQANQGTAPEDLSFNIKNVSVDLGTEWVHTWGTGANEVSNAIAADPTGEYIYSVGYIGTAAAPDALIMKYQSDGTLVWAEKLAGLFFDVANDVAVASDGCIYVTGWTMAAPFGISKSLFLLKLNPDGSQGWATTLPAGLYSVGNSVAIYGDSIYVTGYGNGLFFGGSIGGDDAILLKYNTGGSLLWLKSFGLTGLDQGESVTIDTTGNVYVSARYSPSGSSTPNGADLLLVKFNSDGAMQAKILWALDSSQPEFSRISYSDGYLYLVGYAGPVPAWTGYGYMFVIKFNTDLGRLWQKYWKPSQPPYTARLGNGMGAAVLGEDLYVAGYIASGSALGLFLLDINKSTGSLVSQKTWDVTGQNESATDITLAGDKLYIGGAAVNASGSWSNMNWSYGMIFSWPTTPNPTLTQPSYLFTIQPTFIPETVSGTLDTGGGGDDALLMKLGEQTYAPTDIAYTGELNWTIPYDATSIDVDLEATVSWTGGGDGSGFYVAFDIYGEEPTVPTTAGGIASYPDFRLPAGEYPVLCYIYDNPDIYANATIKVTQEVYAPTDIDYSGDLHWVVPYNSDTTDVTLKADVDWTPESADGSDLPVVFVIGDDEYSATTEIGGVAQYTLPLAPGVYEVSCYTPDILGFSDTATIEVEKPTGIDYTGQLFYTVPIGQEAAVTLEGTVSYASPPSGCGIPVVFFINGTYHDDPLTVSGGVAQHGVSLPPGDYPVSCYSPDTGGCSDSEIIHIFAYDPNAETFITGGGWIPAVDPDNPDGKADFGFNAKYLKDGTLKGTFTYLDGAVEFYEVAVTELYFGADGKSALFGGDGYWAYIIDNGEPGINIDYIRVWTASYANSGLLCGGNIQVHSK